MSNAEPFIEIAGLSKSFQGVTVLRHLDLDVPRGKIVTLLGPSGCGKTTTLRCIAGLELPDAGTIRIGGTIVDGPGVHLAPRQRGLGIVFQSFALWPHMRVSENVAFPLKRKGVAADKIASRVSAVLDLVGLSHASERFPGQLSGGQQQRVALARAVVGEPGAILYDEPLSNLDARLREQMRREIGDLHRRLGMTAVFVTHDQEEAIDLSDEIHVMRDGVVVQKGGPIEIFDRPCNKYVCEFFGQANIFRIAGTVRSDSGFAKVVTAEGHELVCTMPVNPNATISFAAVRPHQIALEAPSRTSRTHDCNVMGGIIRSVRQQGTRTRYQVDTGQGVVVDVDIVRPGPGFVADDQVNLLFAATACVGLEA